MDIKNIVKVMNFHSLLRVDKARKDAELYFNLESELREMIDIITNNRNFVLDKKQLRINADNPVLNIYIGSDFGFCGGYNFIINEKARKDIEADKILLGKKLWKGMSNVRMHLSREEFNEEPDKLETFIEQSVREKRYSEINIIYNSYENAGNIKWVKKRIFPFEFNKGKDYKDDFICETDINELLTSMVSAYIIFELKITIINSFAAENIMRQNSTADSMKKIDEIEEETKMMDRKARNTKEFQKVIENYSKIKVN